MSQKINVGERLLLSLVVQHGQWVIRIAAEVFLETVRNLQDPAHMQENPRGDLIPSGFPGGNTFGAYIDAFFLKPVRKFNL